MNVSRIMASGVGAAFLSLVLTGMTLAAPGETYPNISGVWWAKSYRTELKPIEGEIPFTPAGRAAYDSNIAGLRDGSLEDMARVRCTPDGVPRIWSSPYPLEIFQEPDLTTFVYEVNHVFRIALMDVEPPPDSEFIAYPYYSGSSFGHWDGDTLVVQARGFNRFTFLDATGLPHSLQLHTIERIRTLNYNELEVVVTIEDREMYSAPWSVRFLYEKRNDVRLDTSYTCGEPHRDVSEVPLEQ